MRPTIVEPAAVHDTALVELKQWLGITRPHEDDLLTSLLHSGLATCEAFIGQTPIAQRVEERVSPSRGDHYLSARPVRSFVSAQLLAPDGAVSPLDPVLFEHRIGPDGTASIGLKEDVEGEAVLVRQEVGIAADWDSAPPALKQGIVRLCAFEYRQRESTDGNERAPPASITVLWRSWRTMRLA